MTCISVYLPSRRRWCESVHSSSRSSALQVSGRINGVSNESVVRRYPESSREKIVDRKLLAKYESTSVSEFFRGFDVDLIGYLVARKIIGRPIVGRELQDSLRQATNTVNSARENFKYGSGNAGADKARLLEANLRIAFHRKFSDINNRSETFRVAAAVKMGAGNCQEKAMLCAALHGVKLGENDDLRVVENKDHMWSEVNLENNERMVMDPWTSGPAVMACDSAYGASKSDRRVYLSFSKNEGEKFLNHVRRDLHEIKKYKFLDGEWDEYRSRAKNQHRDILLYPRKSVLSEEFKSKVRRHWREGIAIDIAQTMVSDPEQARAISESVRRMCNIE